MRQKVVRHYQTQTRFLLEHVGHESVQLLNTIRPDIAITPTQDNAVERVGGRERHVDSKVQDTGRDTEGFLCR